MSPCHGLPAPYQFIAFSAQLLSLSSSCSAVTLLWRNHWKTGLSTWFGDYKMAHMVIKANRKHLEKACLVVVLWFAVCSTCITKSDIRAYIIYFLVNWKEWDVKWLAEILPVTIFSLSGRLQPWFEIFMLATTKKKTRLSSGWMQLSL